MVNKNDKSKGFRTMTRENPLDEQSREINQWQNHSANLDYSVEGEKAQLPMENLSKSSVLMIVVGVLFAIPIIIFLVEDCSVDRILDSLFMIVISFSFILGGILRIKRKSIH